MILQIEKRVSFVFSVLFKAGFQYSFQYSFSILFEAGFLYSGSASRNMGKEITCKNNKTDNKK